MKELPFSVALPEKWFAIGVNKVAVVAADSDVSDAAT
jgi:hypothetical protein